MEIAEISVLFHLEAWPHGPLRVSGSTRTTPAVCQLQSLCNPRNSHSAYVTYITEKTCLHSPHSPHNVSSLGDSRDAKEVRLGKSEVPSHLVVYGIGGVSNSRVSHLRVCHPHLAWLWICLYICCKYHMIDHPLLFKKVSNKNKTVHIAARYPNPLTERGGKKKDVIAVRRPVVRFSSGPSDCLLFFFGSPPRPDISHRGFREVKKKKLVIIRPSLSLDRIPFLAHYCSIHTYCMAC